MTSLLSFLLIFKIKSDLIIYFILVLFKYNYSFLNFLSKVLIPKQKKNNN